MNIGRELEGIWSLEWRRLRSSPRVIILALLYVLSSGLLVFLLGSLSAAFQAQLHAAVDNPENAAAAAAQMRMGVLGYLFEGTDPQALEALAHIPLIVFFGYRAVLFFVPLWVALLGFDAVSEELATRSIRYLSLRARRSAIVVGKFLTLSAVLMLVLGVLTAGLLLYAHQLDPEFTGKLWILTLIRLWGAASLFALGYLGLTLFCSTWVASPALALALNLVALLGFWFLDAIGSSAAGQMSETAEVSTPVWSYLRFVSPSHYGPMLLHPDPSKVGWGAGAFAIFVVVSVGAASLIMERRDL